MKKGYAFLLMGCVLSVSMLDTPADHQDMSVKPVDAPAQLTQREARLAGYFASVGSPVPVAMARATARAKRPRLLAAVAAVESNGTPDAIGKAGEVTAWQIREALHGDAGDTVADHCRAAEAILESLIREEGGRIRPALSRYNGDRSGRYADKVMEEVARVGAL